MNIGEKLDEIALIRNSIKRYFGYNYHYPFEDCTMYHWRASEEQGFVEFGESPDGIDEYADDFYKSNAFFEKDDYTLIVVKDCFRGIFARIFDNKKRVEDE